MSGFMLPVLITIFLVLVLARYGKYLQVFIEWVLARFLVLPQGFGGQILPALARVIILNWYTYLMLLLVFVALYLTPVGKDIVIAYLDNLYNFKGFHQVFGSLGLLFICTFFFSLVIWILPFYLYSNERRDEILSHHKRFYLSTKLLAFLAMGPFIIITNAFLYHSFPAQHLLWKAFILNACIFALFTGVIFLLRNKKVPQLFKPVNDWLHRKIENGYFVILIKIFLWMAVVICLFSAFVLKDYSRETMAIMIFCFMLLASLIVFRLLFYSSQDGEDSDEQIYNLVSNIINPATAHHSKHMYRILFRGLLLVNLFYYLAPSLEATNTLYILLSVFSFFIIYLDYFRNLYHNRTGVKKLVALAGTLLFLATPFLTSQDQFRVVYRKMPDNLMAKRYALEDALLKRIQYIRDSAKKNTVFIVCAMGGGSRAGYITAGTLHAIDGITYKNGMEGSIWDQTLCYSTISGGSVGMYHYIKGKTEGIPATDTTYLPFLYKKNYNSSGVFGLLLGDPLETLFGSVAITLKKWVTGENPPNGYFDRNYRVRMEYDYVLQQALQDNHDTRESRIYPKKTFYPLTKRKPFYPDSFKTFFIQHYGSVPIHLVNTFEVNTGRRAILSPFAAREPQSLFPNAVLPLQFENFDECPDKKDITYREAVNMSELFPLVSAASYMGSHPNAQFVDGGYYENYGLSSALDIYYFLKKTPLFRDSGMQVKILLIKNSKQEPAYSSRNIQLLAPLIGAMNAPFTGHANHLQAETQRVLGDSNFLAITFNADSMKVPLTRALNNNHIESMNIFLDGLKNNSRLLQFIHSR